MPSNKRLDPNTEPVKGYVFTMVDTNRLVARHRKLREELPFDDHASLVFDRKTKKMIRRYLILLDSMLDISLKAGTCECMQHYLDPLGNTRMITLMLDVSMDSELGKAIQKFNLDAPDDANMYMDEYDQLRLYTEDSVYKAGYIDYHITPLGSLAHTEGTSIRIALSFVHTETRSWGPRQHRFERATKQPPLSGTPSLGIIQTDRVQPIP